jgi:hypothetical protein
MAQIFQFQTVPFEVSESLTGLSTFMAESPWKTFQFTGGKGTTHGGEDVFVVNFEWPYPYFVRRVAVNKHETESLHLNRYMTDFLIATGSPAYLSVNSGADPPDFTCLADSKATNLDCTQFTSPTRRTANSLFERVRKAVLRQPREQFAKLRGCTIYTWFEGADGKLALPFRASDEQAAAALVKALADYTPDVQSLRLPTADLPLQAPRLPIAAIEGCRFYAVGMTDAVPATDFFAYTGFELGLPYTTTHSRRSLIDELIRVIRKHDDKPGIDHLLITAGGPDNDGLSFLSEHVLCAFMLEGKFELPPTTNLSKVVLHLWHTGAIVQLVPNFLVVRGDLYPAGVSVASHRGAPQPA